MSNDLLVDLTQPRRVRPAYAELRMRLIGEIRHQDLIVRFGIQAAAASRALSLHKDFASSNIDFDSKSKSYICGPDFQPVFDFAPERMLSRLTRGFRNGEPMRLSAKWTRIAARASGSSINKN